MRNLTCVGAVLFAIVGVSVGCADDESGSGGAGGSVETTTTTAASTSPSTTTTGASTSTSSSASSTSTGMTALCTGIEAAFVDAESFSTWSGDVVPDLGTAEPDSTLLGIPIGSSGTITLELPTDIDDCGDTQACMIVFEDFVNGSPPARVYASSSGTITLDAPTTAGTASGLLDAVELVEVTLDDATGGLTPVRDGQCLILSDGSFEFQSK